jgi:Mg2+ and Co2+ transporter CorA
MRILGVVGGIVLTFMGVVWALQGVNSAFVPVSFMTGSSAWVFIGLAAAASGIALTWWSWRR